MVKKILILIISISFSSLHGQTIYLNLGTSFSKLDWKYVEHFHIDDEQQYHDPLQTFTVSAGIEYFEHKYYSITSDLYYYQSGGKYSEEEKNTIHTFKSPDKISISYLSIGSSFNFNPIDNKFKLQLCLGPRVDYIINSASENLHWIDERNGLNKFNFGFTAGIGFYYSFDKYHIGVKAQYLNRIRKLADIKPAESFPYNESGVIATEQVYLLGISLGYIIKSSKN